MDTWTCDEFTSYSLGDSGPWARHVGTAWRAVSDPSVPLPPDPTPAFRRDEQTHHGVWLAYWAPLLQLTHFGLGWTRTDLGLAEWMRRGRPTDDPVLALVEKWWGPHLADYISEDAGLLRVSDTLHQLGQGTYLRTLKTAPLSRQPPAASPSAGLWPGGDTMHSADHFPMALIDTEEGDPPPGVVARPPEFTREGSRAVLIQDRYAGWHKNLWSLNDSARTQSGRSLRVDVVCTSVGWLGEFRRSTVTGAWFRCRHRWHLLGA